MLSLQMSVLSVNLDNIYVNIHTSNQNYTGLKKERKNKHLLNKVNQNL